MISGHLFRRLGALWPAWHRDRRTEGRRLAVLIDGEGVSPRDARRVLDFLTPQGTLVVLRTYANFNSTSATAWTDFVRQHGGIGRHLPNLASGKNGSDIALAIDAMDLLRLRKLDTIALVASDSDFTPLAFRIRETDRDVLGFGQRSTPAAFRRACTAFHQIDQLGRVDPIAPLWSLSPIDAEPTVMPILTRLCTNGEPVELTALGLHLAKEAPGFDPRIYRRRTLSSLLRDLPGAELVERDGKLCARPRPPPD